jgi:tetratricopeptide (TPR) repeat protein
LNLDDNNTRAHYYKGKIFKKLNQQSDAVLHFEQVIKHNSDEALTGSSLFEIAKIRIKEKDFYEAYHNLQRAVHFEFKSKKFSQYKFFTEGVLFIMKRKVKKGVKLLSQLVDGVVTFDVKDLMNSSSPLTIGNGIINLELKEDLEGGKVDSANLNSFLIYLIYVYRAYGHIVLSNYDVRFKIIIIRE